MARLRAAAIALGCGLSISARIERLRELRENNWLYGMSSGKLLSKSVKRKPGLDTFGKSLSDDTDSVRVEERKIAQYSAKRLTAEETIAGLKRNIARISCSVSFQSW